MRALKLCLLMILIVALELGCASGREFWTYVVEPPVEKPLQREKGTQAAPGVVTPHAIKIAYSDGSTSTEVQVPVLTSGQIILIDHKGRPADKALALSPLPMTEADKPLDDAYVKSGKTIAPKTAAVSIVKSHAMVKNLVKQGNFSLALEYIDQLLQKYPQHVESLKTKGSLLLKMGEKEAALDAYQKAQDLQPDPQVEKQIQILEQEVAQ